MGNMLFKEEKNTEDNGIWSKGIIRSERDKGRFHLRFSGIRPLRGYPPPLLTENQSEKKKVFFLSGKGGYPPPLTESPLSFSGKFFPKRAKNDVFSLNKVKNGPKRPYNGPKRAKNA